VDIHSYRASRGLPRLAMLLQWSFCWGQWTMVLLRFRPEFVGYLDSRNGSSLWPGTPIRWRLRFHQQVENLMLVMQYAIDQAIDHRVNPLEGRL
jgi:hypothetical protein